MRARALGAGAAAVAFAAGAPWWAALAGALLAQLPGRLAPVAAAVAMLALLEPSAGPWWRDLLSLAAGMLAAWACLARLGRGIPWVALPWVAGGVLALGLAWRVLPPAHFWGGSDLAVRARVAAIAALMLVASALTYRPRYRNVPGPAPAPGGGGTTGARDATR